tara:strand:- start:151 stop:366 length:216 start_codon:yes stop_codon:yes gene_type:complete
MVQSAGMKYRFFGCLNVFPGHPQVLVAITTTFTRQFICLLLLINVNSELTHKVLNIKEVICTISPITGADK